MKILAKVKAGYEHPEEAVRRIREIVARGQPVRGEEVCMADGCTCLRDFIPIELDGKPYGRLWHHIDISQRKQAEERTRLLSDVTAQLLASDQPQRIVETLCRRVMEHLGCQSVLQFPGGRAIRPPAPERLRRHPRGDGPADRVARLRRGGVRLRGRRRLPDRGRSISRPRPTPAPIWSALSASRPTPATR